MKLRNEQRNMSNSIVEITLNKGRKRSWEAFRDTLNKDGRYPIDLRKASKTNVPLSIKTSCCDSKVEIRQKKDFPLKNKKCKCKAVYLIKWSTAKKNEEILDNIDKL